MNVYMYSKLSTHGLKIKLTIKSTCSIPMKEESIYPQNSLNTSKHIEFSINLL